LELLTAWTPAHSDPRTLTYKLEVTPALLARALLSRPDSDPGGPDIRWVDCDDAQGLIALHREIESGRRLLVAGPPKIDGSYVRVPIREGSP
jgi:hypothetical protein